MAGRRGGRSRRTSAGTGAGRGRSARPGEPRLTLVGAKPPDDAAEADTGPDADPEAVARQICLRMLAVAPRTRAQLATAMARRGVPEEAADALLARFAEVKLIDDEMFARAWVDSRHHGRGLASRALGAELRQRGVAREDIETALSGLDPEQELDTARELVARRLAGSAGLPTVARMRRLAGMLARKGYPPSLAYRVVREALENEPGAGRVRRWDLDQIPEPCDDELPDEA